MRKSAFLLVIIAVILFLMFFSFNFTNLIPTFNEGRISFEQNPVVKNIQEFILNSLKYIETVIGNRIILDNGRLIIDFRTKTGVLELPSSKESVGTDSSSFANLPSVNSEKDLYLLIKNTLHKNEGEITFIAKSSFCDSMGSSCSSEDIITSMSDVVKLVLSHHPEIGYTDKWTVSVVSYNNDVNKVTIKFDYFYPKDKLEKIKEEVNIKAKEIISKIITPNMTELQKAKAIHDYIVKHTKYDYKNYLNNTIPLESFTAYGVLIKGVGVCQGYTAAFNLLAHMAGIDSLGVSGTGFYNGKAMPHAWNMVRIDGKIRYIDVTWDDPVPDRGNKVMYTYFNVTEKQLEKDHKWDKEKFSEKYFDYK